MSRRLLRGLGKRLEEDDHAAREGTGGLRGEQVHEIALLQRVVVVTRGGVHATHTRAAVERRISGCATRHAAEDESAKGLQGVAEREGVTVGG